MDLDTQDVVWVVVAALLVLALIAAAVLALRHRSAVRREERLADAEKLRGTAAERVPDVRAAAEEARVARTEADLARARAEEAERTAAAAHVRLAQEEAVQEDVVRRADELDPRVDTAADDYRPVTGPDLKASTVPTTPTDGPRHRN